MNVEAVDRWKLMTPGEEGAKSTPELFFCYCFFRLLVKQQIILRCYISKVRIRFESDATCEQNLTTPPKN